MVSLHTTSPNPAPAAADHSKAVKAGAEFEAILLNNLLGGLERAFTNLPGKKEDHSTEAYSGLAMQALTSGLAENGGIGVGRLITQSLNEHTENSAGRINNQNR
jgi:Rod binding domain-containing protein